jgi:hypothetical protein
MAWPLADGFVPAQTMLLGSFSLKLPIAIQQVIV